MKFLFANAAYEFSKWSCIKQADESYVFSFVTPADKTSQLVIKPTHFTRIKDAIKSNSDFVDLSNITITF